MIEGQLCFYNKYNDWLLKSNFNLTSWQPVCRFPIQIYICVCGCGCVCVCVCVMHILQFIKHIDSMFTIPRFDKSLKHNPISNSKEFKAFPFIHTHMNMCVGVCVCICILYSRLLKRVIQYQTTTVNS